MRKYIDADELLKEASKDGAYGYVSAEQIADFPAADVVEVVRCRECKYYIEREDGYICANDYLYKDSEWFCADGEKNE